MKTCLALSSLLLVVVASAGYATAPPSDLPSDPALVALDRPAGGSVAPAVPAQEADQAAADAAPVSLCTEAAQSPFPQPPIPVQTCGCLRAPCIIGGNCCGDLPDPYCGQKLKGHNRYAGRCDVLGCEGVCCKN